MVLITPLPPPVLCLPTFPNEEEALKSAAVCYFSVTEGKKTNESLPWDDDLQAVLHRGHPFPPFHPGQGWMRGHGSAVRPWVSPAGEGGGLPALSSEMHLLWTPCWTRSHSSLGDTC